MKGKNVLNKGEGKLAWQEVRNVYEFFKINNLTLQVI